MKITGFLLLVSGWLLVIAAIILLKAGSAQNAFVLAAVAVEAVGLILVARAHLQPRGDARG
jgi:hypothetical protein